MLINISKRISNDEFEGTIQIQSTRPIYGTSYKSTLFNFIDNNFRFKYLEFQSLEFSETTHISNLTSVLAFYVNIILGPILPHFLRMVETYILLRLKE